MSFDESKITLHFQGKIAVITLNVPDKLNALTQDLYYLLGSRLREVAKRIDIYITVLIGKGRYFSAYAPPCELVLGALEVTALIQAPL